MIDYGQFCTVARGAEVLCDRWTPLVVRELLCGSTQFNEIRRGVPRMSPALLSTRLKTLEEFGVIMRHVDGRNTSYELTPAGEELRPIVLAMGHWGARWIGSRLRPDQLDAGFLMWDVRRFVQLKEFPDRQVVIHFHFPDAATRERHWWLVVEDGVADLCRDDPGHELTLEVRSTVRALTDVWSGDASATEMVRGGDISVVGPVRDADRLWTWLGTSAFAPTRAQVRAG
ncbi:DNA-binding HxlR family transcriptional regulator [Aeromicrobium panaciterrae]|uniref:DNA-binding HxlR family transcriptional regulator n=1 Tax=Aeromicrobium panaciterrae TaxID=363861 RepID=A0ABU1UKR6_9ACTN|nr:helix-turn-helix domain-containing protein [Aeromicrobium panaciterrae]MDR7085776.1 DNA-binding HxlR family transcriptional regulator [Aeromicrobium panaciterrae]